MGPPSATVTPETPAAVVRRRLEGETLRSLIVAEGRRPVGVVRWRDLGPEVEGRLAGEVMTTNLPVVRPEMTLAEARALVHDVDVDLIPVVNDQGELVGEIHRAQLVLVEIERPEAEGPVATSSPTDEEPIIHVVRGMDVEGADGDKIGEVDDVAQDELGRITHLVIRRGLLFKHRKRIPVDEIARVETDRIVLSITEDDVDRLPDLEE
jgi:CBS domain-containing protein